MVGEMSTKVKAVGTYKSPKFGTFRVRIKEVCEENGVEYALCDPIDFISMERWIPFDMIYDIE